jgi:hypothetical protein
MKYPKLVRGAKTPVHVVIVAENTNEFGERETLLVDDFKCNYQDTAKINYTAQKQSSQVTGVIYIDGDILPGVAVISAGYVDIFGERREIKLGCKARNLDGSVNYTRLEVI